MCVKIVAECKEDVLLETVAIRETTVAQKGQSQISLPKHKTISQNTNQFTETQNNFSKHKPIFQSTNQFLKTQTNFVETQIKRLGTCSVIIREPGKDSFPGLSASNMATSKL